MRIRRRWTLILLLSTCQVALLLGAVIALNQWTAQRVRVALRRQILADNRLMSETLSRDLGARSLKGIEHGDEGWQDVQQMVRETKLPNQGLVCVIRTKDGSLLCHPKVEDAEELRKMQPGNAVLQTDLGPLTIAQAAQASEHGGNAILGWARMPNGVHYLAVNAIPEQGLTLMVHQHESSVQAAIDATIMPIRYVAAGIASVLTLLSIMANVLLVRRYESKLSQWNDELEQTVADRTRALIKTRNAVIFGLAKLSESRDTDTGTHLDRIRDYTLVLAEELQDQYKELTPSYRHDLGVASSLHDIGKVGVPDAVLLKPGALTSDERKIINTHSAIGGECLAAIQKELGEDDFLELAKKVAFHHHERWDGLGYPGGLSEFDIPLAARIVTVADVYDALTTVRPYKAAMTHCQAATIIAEGAGRQFEPAIVEAFFAREKDFRAIKARYSALDAGPNADADSNAENGAESETQDQVVGAKAVSATL